MEKMISVYWFVILLLVAGGVTAMVFTFYSHPYDVREAEATILTEQIADCISSNGVINDWALQSLSSPDFLEKCHINFNTESELEQGQYYVRVNVISMDNREISSFNGGNAAITTHCDPQASEEIQELSKCVNSTFYTLDNSGNQYLVNMLSIVRKTVKNVK